MADKAHIAVDNKLAVMEKRISAIYSTPQKKALSKMLDFSKEIEKKSNELLKAVKEAESLRDKHKAKTAYISFYQKVTKSRKFKSVSKDISFELYNTNVKATEYINSQAPDIYALNFNYINNELAKDIDGFKPLNVTAEEVEKYGDLTMQTVSKDKDTKWNRDNLAKALIAGAALLMDSNQVVKRATKVTYNKNHNFAVMHASGIATYGENKGRLDAMYRASDMGIVIQKQWRATLDNRTRDTHVFLDGNTVDLDDFFENGLEYPRDPNGEAREICNCRCRLRYVTSYTEKETRSARRGTVSGSYQKSSSWKNTESIEIEDMDYAEWMEWREKNID